MDGNIEFLWLHTVLAADALIEISTVVISAVLSLVSRPQKLTFSVSQNCMPVCVLFLI